MWMLGYEDGEEFNFPSDNCFNRKLRPLIPRANHQPPCLSRFSGAELFSLNHHFAEMGDQTKRTELNLQQPAMMSSRWNPTPEQLRTLEELYRRGTRTPSADQIQHITAQLRRYGKIEGKNVFYWFQNHKARERLKRRRQMESVAEGNHRDTEILDRKDSGANRTTYEAEQTKNWALPTSTITTPAEESVPIQTAAKGTVPAESCRAGHEGWIQFERDHEEFHLQQQRRSFTERNATWQKMQLPSSTAATTRAAVSVDHNKFTIPSHEGAGGLNVFLSAAAPYKNGNGYTFNYLRDVRNVRAGGGGEDGCREYQTLELFPLGSDITGDDDEKAAETDSGMNGNNNRAFANSCQYFEFLPLKN